MVSPIQRQRWSLTGRVRVRPGAFGKQVLQVEVLTEWLAYRAPPRPDHTADQAAAWRSRPDEVQGSRTAWRDAQWDDMVGKSLAMVQPEAVL